MITIICECGQEYTVRIAPVHCKCGKKAGIDRAANFSQSTRKPNTLRPCTHRGEQIGVADCDCATKPPVFACDLHSRQCMRNRPVAGPVLLDDGKRIKATEVINCRTCPDHSVITGQRDGC